MEMIVIVDYGMGNLRSVQKGFERVGYTAVITNDPNKVGDADAIVLPGVGAFRDCMRNLNKSGLIDPIKEFINKGKPFLGICLGLQLLFTESEEFGVHKGLDIIKGRVIRFPDASNTTTNIKIPHMGWNSVRIRNRVSIFEGIPDDSYFYFVHSYYVVPKDEDVIAMTTNYGVEFTSAIVKGNLFAVQFHPEKSQELGLKILRNFGEIHT
ncbi:MAG: imidazole glycerol phosphate synthase subunit HisH [Nitrospinae bacterium]|nr:imidazole glycerol phosphate synthase subunit HisH [Nitrospinota bacterium]